MKKLCLILPVLLATNTWADDANNRCAGPMPPSANISPADDAVHVDASGAPSQVYEQWYWNTVLVGKGKTYGVETLVFQFAFFPGFILDVAQIAFTDVATGEFHSQFVWGGGGPFIPSAGYPFIPNGFDLALADGDGSFRAIGGAGHDVLSFNFSDGTTVSLTYDGTKNPAAGFFDGIGHYIDPVTSESHGTQKYYNRRQMAATGTIQRPGKKAVAVVGVGWFDRQFGTVIGTPGTQTDNLAWKWFSLHLSDDTEYMIWDMYAVDTGNNVLRAVNKIGEAPACAVSTHSNVTITGLGVPVFSVGPPPTTLENGNHISMPSEGLELDARMILNNQVIESGGLFSPFLEGMITVTGTRNGHPIAGVGYYEQFVAVGSGGGCCQGL